MLILGRTPEAAQRGIVVNTCCMHSWETLASAVHAEMGWGGGEWGCRTRGILRGLRGRIETVKTQKKKGQANVEETSSKLVPALASNPLFSQCILRVGKCYRNSSTPRQPPLCVCVCLFVCVERRKFTRQTQEICSSLRPSSLHPLHSAL